MKVSLSGFEVMKQYGCSVGELAQAVRGGLVAHVAVTGERVVEQGSLVPTARFLTAEEAMEFVNKLNLDEVGLLAIKTSGVNWQDVDIRTKQRLALILLDKVKDYKFPRGEKPPQEGYRAFPLCYEEFAKKYGAAITVIGKETISDAYSRIILAFRFKPDDAQHWFSPAKEAVLMQAGEPPASATQEAAREDGEPSAKYSALDELTRAKALLPELDSRRKMEVQAWIDREEHGWTVDQLAEQLNKSKRTAEGYLTDARRILKP